MRATGDQHDVAHDLGRGFRIVPIDPVYLLADEAGTEIKTAVVNNGAAVLLNAADLR